MISAARLLNPGPNRFTFLRQPMTAYATRIGEEITVTLQSVKFHVFMGLALVLTSASAMRDGVARFARCAPRHRIVSMECKLGGCR